MFNQILGLIGGVILGALMIIGAGLLYSLPIWLLWNYCLVGAVAGISKIGWLQSWGIAILCGFLFKSKVSVSKKE